MQAKQPFAWVVIAEPNQTWSFCRTRKEAEHTANNLLTYAKGCTGARIEPLDLGNASEQVAQFMIRNSFATGHGDTLSELLGELELQVKERAAKAEAWVVQACKMEAERDRLRTDLDGWLDRAAKREGRLANYGDNERMRPDGSTFKAGS